MHKRVRWSVVLAVAVPLGAAGACSSGTQSPAAGPVAAQPPAATTGATPPPSGAGTSPAPTDLHIAPPAAGSPTTGPATGHGAAAASGTAAQQHAAAGGPAAAGSWSPVMKWPVVAVHSHLLPDGRVLSWEEGEAAFSPAAREIRGYAAAAVWDPATGRFTDVRNPTTNVFASGHAFLPDGRLLVSGGQSIRNLQHPRGTPHTNTFDFRDNRWRREQNMREGRWYPTSITLATGEVLTVGGNDDRGVTNQDVQVFTREGTWRYISRRKMSLYPGMFLAPTGEVFYAGPKQQTLFLNPETGAWRDGPVNRFIRKDNIKTIPSVMYDGTVLTVGGGNVGAKGGFTAAAGAESVDLNAPDPQWRPLAPMRHPRRHHNATLLPDSTVLVTGGQREGYNEHPIHEAGVRAAEAYDPQRNTWSTLSAMKVPRGYHSTALLLPDGRVLIAGTGNGAAVDEYNAQIFSPPYLHRGPRPTVSGAPAEVAYGEQFSVGSPDAAAIENVRLIRLGSTTHSFDMNTRLVTLGFTRVDGALTVTAPKSGAVAPPGHYMLFVLNTDGVPSVARIVRVGGGGG